jgi:hypothetical protein
VAVYSRRFGAAPVSVGFTTVRFGPVDPGVLRFTPPPGARVITVRPPARRPHARPVPNLPGPVGTFGHDWATVFAARTPPVPPHLGERGGFGLQSVLPYSGPLFSIRLLHRAGHDWVLWGLVPQTALAEVGSRLP